MPLLNFDKTVPYVKKKGIAGYFQLIRNNFSDLIILNVLFIVTSIPIVTIGPSILALNRMTMAMVSDTPTSFVKEYFSYFKKYFSDGLVCGLCFILAMGLSGFSVIYYFSWGKTTPVMYVFSVIALICFFLIIMTASFFSPMYCCVDLKKSILLKNSFLLSLSYLKISLAVLGIIALFSILIFIFFPYSLPLVAMGPVSFAALAACYGSLKPIQSHVISKA